MEFATILRRRGPLEAEFAKLGETFLIEAPRWEHRSLGARIANRLGWRAFESEQTIGCVTQPFL